MDIIQNITDHLTGILVTLAASILLVLINRIVTRVLNMIRDRTGLIITAHMEEVIRGAIREGIYYAEEQGRKALKGSGEIPSGEKRDMAREFAQSILSRESLATRYTNDQMDKLIESELGHMRGYMGTFGGETKKGVGHEFEESK